MADGEPDLSEETVWRKSAPSWATRTLKLNPGKSTWYVNQQHANHFSVGRVFCGGDAIHRHPPSSGLGLNTCIQDAHNLAWKLAYVCTGGPEKAC